MAILIDFDFASRDAADAVNAGGIVTFYNTGTTTLKTVYSDSALSTPLANPYTLDNAGRFGGPIYAADGERYAIKEETSGGAEIRTRDPVWGTVEEPVDSSYTPSHTGAVSRTVASKLDETVSVTDFGATGDGATDDTAAVQAAIDAGNAFFPAGTYLISSTLTVPSSRLLSGDGRGSIVKLASASNTNMVQNSNYSAGTNADITILNLAFDGNVANQTNNGSYDKMGIAFKGVTNARIEGCHVFDQGTDCLNLINCTNPVVVNNELEGAYNHACTFENTDGFIGKGNIVHNCGSTTDAYTFTSSGHAFIGVNVACDDAVIEGNYIYSMGDSCIRNERAGRGWTITGNVVIDSGKDSIKVMGLVGTTTKPKANVITGNVVINAGNNGIVANGDQLQVTGNVIWGTGKNTSGSAAGKWFASASGISITDGSTDVVVENNYVRDAYAYGIAVLNGTTVTQRIFIRGNTSFENGADGIRCTDTDYVVIEGNYCYNNSQGTAATDSGIRYDWTTGSRTRVYIRGNHCFDTGGVDQKWGISIDGAGDVTNVLIEDNVLWGNTSGPLYSNLTDASVKIRRNDGHLTENRGTGTIASGNTSVAVTHGLSVTPSLEDISVIGGEDPTNAIGHIWISGITSSQFTVNVNADPGASGWDFGWHVA